MFKKAYTVTEKLIILFSDIFGFDNETQKSLSPESYIDDIFKKSSDSHSLVKISFAVEKCFGIELNDSEVSKLISPKATLGTWLSLIQKKINQGKIRGP